MKRGSWPQRGWNDALLVPLYDIYGNISTVQAINIDDTKDLLKGGKMIGCFLPFGKIPGAAVVLILEGLANTAAAFYATELPAVMGVNADNLKAVAAAIRQLNPDAEIIIIADDDQKADGTNRGKVAAIAAALAVGGKMAIPNLGRKADAWDIWNEQGPEGIIKMIDGAIVPDGDKLTPLKQKNDVTAVTNVQANTAGLSGVTSDINQDVTDETLSIPLEARPCYQVFDDWTKIIEVSWPLRPGVWYFWVKQPKGKGEHEPTLHHNWICSPLKIEAVTHDGQEKNFGRLLRFLNTNNRWREWAMPMELLRGSGDELRGELLAMGVEIDPKSKNEFGQYLQSKHPKRRVHCALQIGWCGDSFVLPDAVIGPKAADVFFQSGERGHDEHTTSGTLTGWQSQIAARAVGNPFLMLALSASFAGPLLTKTHSEGGGFHFVGDSSTGKSTAIEAACATWGGPNFKRSWKATANGMEGAAALFNDCLLALDEISECDPREVGAIVYQLGNGVGKQRASRTGTARNVTRWRCFVLSSGERTIGTVMAEGGHRIKAGQEVRLVNVSAARRFGAFDELHEFQSGPAFSDAIRKGAVTHYGHAGRAFLEKLTRDQRNFCEFLEGFKAMPEFSAKDGQGQEKRVAGRFALVAMAGELATEYGLTGWPEGAAIEAAAVGFNSWRFQRGRGNNERQQIVEQLSGFIERNGDSRFSDADKENDDIMRINRAGWWRDDPGGRVYLFHKDGLREALKGFDFKRALDELQEVGALSKPGATGERAKPVRIGSRPPIRLYEIYADKLGAADHGA